MSKVKRMRLIADDGNGSYKKRRLGSRAILFKDGKILLAHEHATGYYCLPGGGHEEGELLSETCIRELSEEVGILVDVHEEVAVVESCWKENVFENHFFSCSFVGETACNRTPEEIMADLQAEWVTLEEAKAIFNDPEVKVRTLKWQGCYKRDAWILEQVC